jgi:hypothetical protein
MKYETAGDPMGKLRWTRKTTRKIARELCSLGIGISANTVRRLLKKMGYSLRVNRKEIASAKSPERNAQFLYMNGIRERFAQEGKPEISVDAKKKELVGNFKNGGTLWSRAAVRVHDHDFRSMADGVAVPYGIYDKRANRGMVFVGTSHDTPSFAVESIGQWWTLEGMQRYPQADHLLILADGGGSNGARCRAWKEKIQSELCDRHGISVTVCHYPPGASKWNPIEHRLFSEITKNWAGWPLESYETVLNYIRTTRTETGLEVDAHLVAKEYCTGEKVSDARMADLNLLRHDTLPNWNYTLAPSQNVK